MFDPKTKFKLFKQNKHFCSAPWTVLYVGMNGYTKPCTRSIISHDLTSNTVEEIASNDKYKTLRGEILKDNITDNCKKCLLSENVTDAGDFLSLRHLYNVLSIDSTVDYTDVEQFQLKALDLHWSSLCDLKCVTCWHKQSSSIAIEQNMPVNHTPPAVADKIIDYVVTNQAGLNEIYLSGGEPTLIKYNLKLLRQIEKRPDLLLRVNTNMQWKQDNAIIQEILKFPNVMFTCSIDGFGEKFNYIRRGGNWNTTLNNIKFLQAQTNVDLRANTVFFVLTAQELPDIIDYFMQEVGAIDHTINQIAMGQEKLRCRNLPTRIKKQVKDKLEDYLVKYSDNLNICGNIKNCLTELEYDAVDDYRQYFDNIDKLQGSNWQNLYPELV
ncbi:twitch domain-containing radical SAM protein [bacterium]|nr:twitch domain-containing radical SAM protein [bacterium]